MKELGFRAWHNYEKKMYDVAELNLFWGLATLQWWEKEGSQTVRQTKQESILGTVDNGVKDPLDKVFGLVIMQYTGLKDRNGTKIYEGDIIKEKVAKDEYLLAEVVYKDGCFMGKEPGHEPEFPIADFLRGKVIGNIYESPELLEAI